MSISLGENIGAYRVIEQLGSGGMATVFKAYHAALDRYVAIKILHPAFKADPQFFERFKREAQIVAKLEHPNIIPVYDFDEHDSEPYLVMRYVEGDTLKPNMKGQPMPVDEILHLMRPVCQALSYAHRQGVLHRDIKPSNIMVTHDDNVFLTDFGLARMVQAGESTLSQDMMLGTPQYISPEQAQGISDLDGRTDVYSLGVVLFEMLTGRVPFNADTPFATVHDHIYSPLPLPRSIRPDIDPGVERMLLKALAKDPNDRFGSTDDLLEAMETTLGAQLAARATHVPPPENTKVVNQQQGLPWWLWAGGAAVLILLMAGVLVGLLLLRRANNNRLPEVEPAQAQVASDQPATDSQADSAPDNQTDQSAPTDSPPPSRDEAQQDTPAVDEPASSEEATELFQQGMAAVREREPEKAADLFQQAIEADPHFLAPYFSLSELLRMTGDEEGSLETLAAAVEQNPDNPTAHMRLGEAHLASQNPEEALTSFQQAVELAPESAGAYAGQAVALLELGQAEAAKTALDEALALDRSNPSVQLANAIYLHNQGETRAAFRQLQQLVQNSPNESIKERARRIIESLRQ